MDWDKLRIFHAVAEAGSITQAGELLHTSQPAVSRQIRNLELEVGAPLFHRHSRGLILTSEGEILYEATREMSGRLNAATSQIRGSKEDVYGAVRLSVPVDFGAIWLIPRLPQLYAAHPGLTLDLHMSEAVLDLPMREADAAIRMRRPTQADVIARHLWTAPMALYASDTYLERSGVPETLRDLGRHDLVAYNRRSPQPSESADWLFAVRHDLPNARPVLVINSLYGVLRAVRGHVGIGLLPDYLGESAGLRRVLPDFVGPELSLHFVYAREMRQSKRVAVLRDFIETQLHL